VAMWLVKRGSTRDQTAARRHCERRCRRARYELCKNVHFTFPARDLQTTCVESTESCSFLYHTSSNL